MYAFQRYGVCVCVCVQFCEQARMYIWHAILLICSRLNRQHCVDRKTKIAYTIKNMWICLWMRVCVHVYRIFVGNILIVKENRCGLCRVLEFWPFVLSPLQLLLPPFLQFNRVLYSVRLLTDYIPLSMGPLSKFTLCSQLAPDIPNPSKCKRVLNYDIHCFQSILYALPTNYKTERFRPP